MKPLESKLAIEASGILGLLFSDYPTWFQPLENVSQTGFIFPKFRGETEKKIVDTTWWTSSATSVQVVEK